jgi:hypothetical protein
LIAPPRANPEHAVIASQRRGRTFKAWVTGFCGNAMDFRNCSIKISSWGEVRNRE